MNLKFRSKFNHGSSNLGYLHCAILKALYSSRVKRAQEVRVKKYFFNMFKIRYLRSLKCVKTTWNLPDQLLELTQKLASMKTAPHSCYSYIAANVSHDYSVISKGLSCCKTPHPEVT